MTKPAFGRSGIILLWALVGTSCGPTASQGVLTVEEVVPRIDELNGQTVSVAGYLSECGGYDCILHRTKADSDAWARVMIVLRANRRVPIPDVPILGIGSGTNFDFDAKAAPFANSYVVITGTITNQCRFQGRPACTDRGADLNPTAIRAGSPPAR
jgi:hypothetical protein